MNVNLHFFKCHFDPEAESYDLLFKMHKQRYLKIVKQKRKVKLWENCFSRNATTHSGKITFILLCSICFALTQNHSDDEICAMKTIPLWNPCDHRISWLTYFFVSVPNTMAHVVSPNTQHTIQAPARWMKTQWSPLSIAMRQQQKRATRPIYLHQPQ